MRGASRAPPERISMIQLTLRLNGKDKHFTADGLTMRASVTAYKLLAKMDETPGEYPPEMIDELTGFVVQVFGEKFTVDDLLDGCKDSFFRVVPGMLRAVVLGVNEAIRSFPENPMPAATAKKKG